jgi:hypothetical protein
MKNLIILLAGYLALSSISCAGRSATYYPYPPYNYGEDYWGDGWENGEGFDEGDDDDFDAGDENEDSDEGEEDRH